MSYAKLNREVNKNNLKGGQFLFFFCPKIHKNYKMGGQPSIFERSNPNNPFSLGNFEIYHPLNVGFHDQAF